MSPGTWIPPGFEEGGSEMPPPGWEPVAQAPGRRERWAVSDLVAVDLLVEELERLVAETYRPQAQRVGGAENTLSPVPDEDGGYVVNCPACWPSPGTVRLTEGPGGLSAAPVQFCAHTEAEILAAFGEVPTLQTLYRQAWTDAFYRWTANRYMSGFAHGSRSRQGCNTVTAGEVLSGSVPPAGRRTRSKIGQTFDEIRGST